MTSYAEAAGAIECDFDPTDRAEALAALCARAVFQGTYGDDHPVVGSQRLADGVAALNTYDMSPRIVPFLTYAAGHPNTRYTPDALVSFEHRFADHDPSLVLGACLGEGLGARAPQFTQVNDLELAQRLTDSGVEEEAAGVSLANMSTLYYTEGRYSLLRACRLLTLPPSPAVVAGIRQVALPHIEWCLRAYYGALELDDHGVAGVP